MAPLGDSYKSHPKSYGVRTMPATFTASGTMGARIGQRMGLTRQIVLTRWLTACIVCMFGAASVRAANAPRDIDARRIAAAGLRILEGRHVRLVTDLAASPGIDELPVVFDAGVAQWSAYFRVPDAQVADARWVGFLVGDREKFAALGLLPAERPDFLSGYANGWEFWLAEQPSDYYRRHLMLHEGTHAFMQTQLGGAGAPWYMEGMAELLGTHEWQDGRLTLGVMPASRDDVPMWGRIKLIRDAATDGRAWPLERVLALDNSRTMATEEYAWAWALAALLDGNPRFQERFRAMQRDVADRRFTEKFRRLFADDWHDLLDEWQSLVSELDYGYEIPRMALVHAESAPVEAASRRSKIDASRGWQSAGWILYAGTTYRVTASGRFQLVRDGETWPCEPGGVTIEYHNGRPTGALLGALRSIDDAAASEDTFARPVVIGRAATITPKHDAELYVRVNDSAAMVGRNTGSVDLQIRQQ